MSLSPRFKKWALGTTIAVLNVGFCADIVQATEQHSKLGKTVHNLSDFSYSSKIFTPFLSESSEAFGIVGEFVASAAVQAILVAGTPGVIVGNLIAKNIHR